MAFDIALVVIDQRPEATGGPSILGLELASSERRALEIAGEWGAHGVYLARLALWIDFGFMLSYGTFYAGGACNPRLRLGSRPAGARDRRHRGALPRCRGRPLRRR